MTAQCPIEAKEKGQIGSWPVSVSAQYGGISGGKTWQKTPLKYKGGDHCHRPLAGVEPMPVVIPPDNHPWYLFLRFRWTIFAMQRTDRIKVVFGIHFKCSKLQQPCLPFRFGPVTAWKFYPELKLHSITLSFQSSDFCADR